MKLCFIAPARNYHTKKWCKYFLEKGYEIDVITLAFDEIEGVNVHYFDTGVSGLQSDFSKIKYLKGVLFFKRTLKEISPDIISVHYASSYGMIAALSGIRNYNLSIWGSDIYEFPKKSIVHKIALMYSLNRANKIMSTSIAMAKEASHYTKKDICVTPFGVDTDFFSPQKRTRKNDDCFVVGTVKTLNPIYGINYLIEAISIVKEERNDINIKLRIAGDGTEESELHELAKKLNLDKITEWLGFISQEQAAEEWANMDVGVICSLQESFGVSALEAESSQIPVIVSDAPGLIETTEKDVTSIVVHRANAREIADAIIYLYDNPCVRNSFGEKGRKLVIDKFQYDKCFKHIEKNLIKYTMK